MNKWLCLNEASFQGLLDGSEQAHPPLGKKATTQSTTWQRKPPLGLQKCQFWKLHYILKFD
jgi:hypothetical protein